MDWIVYYVVWGVYQVVLLVPGLLIAAVFAVVLPQDSTAADKGILIGLTVYLLVSTWPARRAAKNLAFEKMLFLEALLAAFKELRLHLSLLPGLGSLAPASRDEPPA